MHLRSDESTKDGRKSLREDSNKDADKGIQIGEENAEITEILGFLSVTVSVTIVRCIAETGRCSRKDLELLDWRRRWMW